MAKKELFEFAGMCLIALLLVRAAWKYLPAGGGGRRARDVLLWLTPDDPLTLHQATEGVLIMGGTGSGKTTGPGDHLARALLKAGCGFCVLTAKVDEFGRWRKFCRETGREKDLIRFAPGAGLCCDVLNYTLAQPGASVEEAAQLVDTLVEVSSRSGSGQGDEAFWRLSAQKTIRHLIRAVWLGTGRCSLEDAYRFLVSAPTSPDQVRTAKDNGTGVPVMSAAAQEWFRDSFAGGVLLKAAERDEPDAKREMGLTAEFWLKEWPTLSDKTRSIIHAMCSNTLEKFLHEIHDLAVGETNVTPEDCQKGKVIILDMPVLKWREPGQFFQIVFKTLVQRATLKRDVKASPRHVVLWADECQFFTSPTQDTLTQTVARSARLVSVMLTQNLPTLYSELGGNERSRHQADSWVSNHMTKLLCANSCHATNEYMSNLVGHHKELFMSGNHDAGPETSPVDEFMGQPARVSAGFAEHWNAELPPNEFSKLAKGGPNNAFTVECVAFQAGRCFKNGRTWLRCRFRQRID